MKYIVVCSESIRALRRNPRENFKHFGVKNQNFLQRFVARKENICPVSSFEKDSIQPIRKRGAKCFLRDLGARSGEVGAAVGLLITL